MAPPLYRPRFYADGWMRYWIGAALALLLLPAIPPSATSWEQLRGGPERNGTAPVPPGAWDVYGVRDLYDGPRESGRPSPISLLVPTPHGIAGLVNDGPDDGCILVRVRDVPTWDTDSIPLDGCADGRIAGYDATNDQLLLCSPGQLKLNDDPSNFEAPVLQARHAATGDLRWAVRPADLYASNPFVADSVRADGWACRGGSVNMASGRLVVLVVGWQLIDDYAVPPSPPLPLPIQPPGSAYNAYAKRTTHLIVEVQLDDGAILDHFSVPDGVFLAPDLAQQIGGRQIPRQIDADASGPNFLPDAISRSSTGFLVSGILSPANSIAFNPAERGPAVAWFPSQLRSPVGAASEVLGGPGTEEQLRAVQSASNLDRWTPGSRWPSAHGAYAAMAFGSRILVIEPSQPAGIRIGTLQADQGRPNIGRSFADPVWGNGALLVPTADVLHALEPNSLETLWTWKAGPDWWIEDLLLGDDETASILLSRRDGAGNTPTDSRLVRLSVADGREIQELPLASPSVNFCSNLYEFLCSGEPRLVFAPLDNQTVFVAGYSLEQLGPARGPAWVLAEFEDAYPAPGTEVVLRLKEMAERAVASTLVNWGDGARESAPGHASVLRHTYAAPGEYSVRATFVYGNGTTATSMSHVYVGGEPPARDGVARLPLGDDGLRSPGAWMPWLVVSLAVAAGTAAVGVAGLNHRRTRQRARAIAPPAVGSLFLGRYAVERVLGAGATGTVWVAAQPGIERRVVIKQLHPSLVDVAEAQSRFEREARILSRLDHPRITRLYDVERVGESWYLVMEYVDGGSLEEQLERGPMSLDHALRTTQEILEGLAHVHAKGIVHRDLKPGNILLTREGRVKIADFGVARSRHGPPTAVPGGPSASPIGTPLYMAPEQLEGRESGPGSDLYSVAVLFHELVTGRHYLGRTPNSLSELRELLARRKLPIPVRGLSPALNAWLGRGLAVRPEDRFPDAPTMAEELRRASL